MTGNGEYIEMIKVNIWEWSVEDVVNWLESVGLQKYVETFQLHNIDGTTLVQLTEEDLKQELNIQVFGDIKKSCTLISD
ncbi:WD repeat, SAM and U-box domain-containing protein 1 [Armadillidium vulgare]|nr:WD repeat, SAM and U-box domain-containing protein 1 [Armadillidium vulgare]